MSLIEKLLWGKSPPESDRETTDDQLNAIMVPLRDTLCDFKDSTGVSWIHILSATQQVSLQLLVQARGLENTRRLYRAMINDMNRHPGPPMGDFMKMSKPPITPDASARLNSVLWDSANRMIAKGHPTEHVAQAYGGFAMMVAQQITSGDLLAKALIAEAAQTLQAEPESDEDEHVLSFLNPLASKKLQDFVVTGERRTPLHYFRFEDNNGLTDEFIVVYDGIDGQLLYYCTLHRRTGEPEFLRLDERAWSGTILQLTDNGARLALRTTRTDGHFASRVPIP